MKTLGIIPARGGSKRVPGKNIRFLSGKPLIAYTIATAIKSEFIDRVIVSTDDIEIADISAALGAETPFLRPKELALGTTPDQPVLMHTLSWLKENDNWYPDLVFVLRPTSPFKTEKTIKQVYDTLIETNADLVRTVEKCEGIFHPYWAYKHDSNGFAKSFIDGIKIKDYYQSQLLPPAYRINGVVDAMKTDTVFFENYFDDAKMAIVEISSEQSTDIDTEMDFKFAEFMMKTISGA